MVEAWDRVDNDPDIRVCILTGAGGYFLCGHGPQGRHQEATG